MRDYFLLTCYMQSKLFYQRSCKREQDLMIERKSEQEKYELYTLHYSLVSHPHLYRQVWPCGRSQMIILINQESIDKSNSEM